MTALSPEWMDWPETRKLMKAFARHHAQIRFVGGCVRDALLARRVEDVDLATALEPNAVSGLLKAAGLKAVPTGLAHGTVTAVVERRQFEITTLRHDVHTDGRHAQVAFTENWKEDAARRDFTMNALYLSFDGELTDFFGGAEDARAGRVIFIGDADARIREDYLRILRFFRFLAHYGKAPADTQALAACARHAAEIRTLSGERIRQEMFRLLAAPQPAPVLALMQQHGVLAEVIPGACNLALMQRLQEVEALAHEQAETETRLALLLDETRLEAVRECWKLSNASYDIIKRLLAFYPGIGPDLTLPAQKKLMRHLGLAPFAQMVLMAWAQEKNPQALRDVYLRMFALAREWMPPVFIIGGDDLKALGYRQGEEIGQVLRRLEMAWEDSDYTLTRHELLQQAKL